MQGETITIEWHQTSGNCDFCCMPMTERLRPVLTDFQLFMLLPEEKQILHIQPPFILCDGCSDQIGLQHGQRVVGIERVQRAHMQVIAELVTRSRNLN